MKKIFLMMFLLTTFIFSGCNTQAAGNQSTNGDLKISMLNIGEGDAILIQTKEQTILIDTARKNGHEVFVKELEKFSVTKIDKLILTHPHGDHIGGAGMLIKPSQRQLEAYPYLKNISVVETYDNDVPYPSAPYKNYIKALQETGIPRHTLKVGDTLDFGGGVKFKVLFPTIEFIAEVNEKRAEKAQEDEDDSEGKKNKIDSNYNINNSSIVGKLTYKNFSMMFTGDCEKQSEAKILASHNAKDLKCDVLKAGHHGIRSSSTEEFVAAVNPSAVVISAGNNVEKNSAKGAPHHRPLETYMAHGVVEENILCTQWNGSITITSDGKTFSVQPEIKKAWIKSWIAKKHKAKLP